MNKWIILKERLPKGIDGLTLSHDVLAYTAAGEMYLAVYDYVDEAWYYNDYKPIFDDVTHWMPLPEPPCDTHKKE